MAKPPSVVVDTLGEDFAPQRRRATVGWMLVILLMVGGLGVGGWLVGRELKKESTPSVQPVKAQTQPVQPIAPPEPALPAKVEIDAGGEPEPTVDKNNDLAVRPLVPEQPPEKVPEKTPVKSPEKTPAIPEKAAVKTTPPVTARATPEKPPVDAGYLRALKQGQALYKAGNLKAAADAFARAIEVNPKGLEALIALANAFFEMDQNNRAIQYAEQAVKLNPRSARAQLTLGTICQTMGKNPEAVKAYKIYLKLEPAGKFAADVRSILKNLE